MSIDSSLSRRIAALRFPLTVAVVLIHARGTTVGFSNRTVGVGSIPPAARFVQDLISTALTSPAVPLFLMFSGFLLFSTLEATRESYGSKLRSRTRSLLVPLLFWNGVTLLLIGLAQSIPALSGYFSGKYKPVADYAPWDYLNALLGISKAPISYHLWFLRDLLVLVACSPLFLWAIDHCALPVSLALFAAWGFDASLLSIIEPESALFFFLGGLWARHPSAERRCDSLGPHAVIVFLLLACADASRSGIHSDVLHKTTLLAGIACWWFVSGTLVRFGPTGKILREASRYAFFVFAAHEPLETVLLKIGYKVMRPSGGFEIMLLYFAAPAVTVLVTVAAAMSLDRTVPAFSTIITGGRNPGRTAGREPGTRSPPAVWASDQPQSLRAIEARRAER